MGGWKVKGLQAKSNGCSDSKVISSIIGANVGHATKSKIFKDETSKLFRIDECLFGKETMVPLDVTYIIIYHTYANGKIIRQEPKIEKNKYPGHYKYVYHDKDDNEHIICIVEWNETFEVENGDKKVSNLPGGYDSTKTVTIPSGDTKESYYYYENNVLTKIVTKGTFKNRPYVSFKVKTSKVILVRMPDQLSYKENGIHIELIWSNTMRRYTSPENFAAFIGALAECGFTVRSAGTAFKDGTGYPSVTHVNGASIDVSYSTKEKDIAIMKAMGIYGYDKENILSGTNKGYSDYSKIDYSLGHEDHIHFGPKKPVVIILKDN